MPYWNNGSWTKLHFNIDIQFKKKIKIFLQKIIRPIFLIFRPSDFKFQQQPFVFACDCRYLGRKKCAQSVCVQPPFLRPQLTEAQLAAKILDNGIQGELHRVSSSTGPPTSPRTCPAGPPPDPPTSLCVSRSSPSPAWR